MVVTWKYHYERFVKWGSALQVGDTCTKNMLGCHYIVKMFMDELKYFIPAPYMLWLSHQHSQSSSPSIVDIFVSSFRVSQKVWRQSHCYCVHKLSAVWLHHIRVSHTFFNRQKQTIIKLNSLVLTINTFTLLSHSLQLGYLCESPSISCFVSPDLTTNMKTEGDLEMCIYLIQTNTCIPNSSNLWNT